MEEKQIIKREIMQKWPVTMERRSAIHRAGLLIPPGNWKVFDPFLLMAQDIMQKGAFSHHPHRGIETVTYIIEGELDHKDNQGNKGKLFPGDVQWMSAGKGILHNEEAPDGKEVHTLQLWVNLPADKKMSEPRYQDILLSKTPVYRTEGVEYRVISGSSGDVRSETLNYAAVTIVEITIQSGHSAKQAFPADYNGFIYVLEGSGIFGSNKTTGSKQEVLWMNASVENKSEIIIEAPEENLKVLVIAGRPLREEVVANGPFVMNTEQQIKEAFADYRAGKFGVWDDSDS